MSLKQKLLQKIEEKNGGIFTYYEFKEYCRIWGKKESNAERRLRESKKIIETVTNYKGTILGYRLKNGKENQNSLF